MVRAEKTLHILAGISHSVHGFLGTVGYDPQGPLRFINMVPPFGGSTRGLGHFRMEWDDSQHDQVGTTLCGNGNGAPCPPLGFVRHAGKRFSGEPTGLAITARGDITGPVGGYGWIVKLDKGAPRNIYIYNIEVLPETPMLVSIAYPIGTTFKISAHAADWCYNESTEYSCSAEFTKATTLDQVRKGPGNQYFVDSNGVLTFRIVLSPHGYVGRPEWFIPSRTDAGIFGGFAMRRFERSGVLLPMVSYGSHVVVATTCGGTGPYCSGTPVNYDPDVCPRNFQQLAYDYCCSAANANDCVFAFA
jgi:hypothetical protein